MKCPSCASIDLTLTDRQGIEIDFCPKCRGIWLDRGELDKIVARSSKAPPDDDEEFRDDHHAGRGGDSRPGHTRRRAWWAELFD
jgi:Zn-finger nucleic acid-binding protein